MDDAQREQWRSTWRATLCETRIDQGWAPCGRAAKPDPAFIITAWNPTSRPLPEPVNAARDGVLREELAALGWSPQRARGRSGSGDWHEDGWLVPYDDRVAVHLLRRYGQLAGFVFTRGGRALIWEDGLFDWLDRPTGGS
jgi:hypothetical protein